MAKISIEIEDNNFDIGTFVSAFASNSKVTVNIFTSEQEINDSDNIEIDNKGEILVEESLPVLSREQLLNKLARMPKRSAEQTQYAEQLHVEYRITWKAIGKALGVGGDTVYRRVQALQTKLASGGLKKKSKAKAKPKPKPKKPDAPKLSDKDVALTVYSIVSGHKKSGVHFSETITKSIIESYEKQYEANKKLTDFKSSIGGRIEDAMNKIALALGPTKCMSSRSCDHVGVYTTQLLTYSKDLPSQTKLEKMLKVLNLI